MRGDRSLVAATASAIDGDIVDGCPEVAILLDVADDFGTDLGFKFGKGGKVQLPEQMVGQGPLLGEHVFEGRSVLVIAVLFT